MQNPESYVAQGKDNTGAAIQLKPFDTSTIFKAYDYQPKKPLLDSLGKDIATPSGAVHPNDRRYVTELKDKWIKYTSEIQAKAAKDKREITGEERQIADAMKMEVIDMTSLLQKQFSGFIDAEKKVEADPFSFEGWEDSKNQFFTKHPLQRGFSPVVNKLPDVDVNKILGDFGTAERSGGSTTNRADGSSSGGTFTKFDPVIAKRNFNDLVVPFLNSGTTNANRVIASLEKDVRKLAELQKLDYTKLSDVDKMSLVLDVAEPLYMAAQEAKVHTRRTSSTSEADAAKVKAAGETSANQPFEVNAGYAYRTIGKNGNIIPIGSDQKGTTEIVDVVQIPIKRRLGGKNDNKEIKLKIPGTSDYATGTVEKISKYSDTKGKWVDQFWATVVDKEGVAKEVPLDAENMRTFKTEYRSDPEEILKKTKNDWKKVAENSELEDPEKSESWNSMDEDRRARYKGAYTRNTRKKKKTDTPAPAPKGKRMTYDAVSGKMVEY